MSNEKAKPDVTAVFKAFSPALIEIARRVAMNNAKHGGDRGRLGGRTTQGEYDQSLDRHVLGRLTPDWINDPETEIDHLAALAFNALGSLTKAIERRKAIENRRHLVPKGATHGPYDRDTRHEPQTITEGPAVKGGVNDPPTKPKEKDK